MQDRRTVLGLAGAGLAAAITADQAAAQPRRAGGGGSRDLTITMIETAAGPSLGVRTPRGVIDVGGAERMMRKGMPTTAMQLVTGKGDIAALRELVAQSPERWLIPEGRVRFATIIGDPEKIICVGLNYSAHAAEGGSPPPKEPILFNKFNNALNHHGGDIRVTGEPSNQWDYEAEMVLVMAKGGRHIPEAQALDYVWGYANGNDFTNRDLQRRSAQWMLGKTTDRSGPFGPWLVGADKVDVNNLDMKLTVNGSVRQSTNTSKMIFNCAQIVAYCSKYFTLAPGDVIFTGTCEGVIMGYPKERQVWLKPGDTMAVSITGLGELKNTLV